MKKIGKKGLAALGILAGISVLLTGCYTSLDNTENAIQREKKYEEEISDTKQNDRETEQELQDILDAAEDTTKAEPEEKEVRDKAIISDEIVLADASKDTGSESKLQESNLQFRKKKYLDEHYEKHGIEMGFSDAEEYLKAANAVVANPDALHKKEAEDNDDIYYVEASNEFVVVSEDGYIRTYFNPGGGIDYYNRQ